MSEKEKGTRLVSFSRIKRIFPQSLFYAKEIDESRKSIIMKHGRWYDGEIFNTTLINFTVNNIYISNSPNISYDEKITISQSKIENSRFTGEPTAEANVDNSSILNSTVFNCRVYTHNCKIVSSVFVFNKKDNNNILSDYDRMTLLRNIVVNSTIYRGFINKCHIKNCVLDNCSFYNSTLINCTLKQSYIEKSTIIRSDTKTSKIIELSLIRGGNIYNSTLSDIFLHSVNIQKSQIKSVKLFNCTATQSDLVKLTWYGGICNMCKTNDVTWMSGSWVNSTWNTGTWLNGSWISGYIAVAIFSDNTLKVLLKNEEKFLYMIYRGNYPIVLVKSKCDPETLKSVFKDGQILKTGGIIALLAGKTRNLSNIIDGIKNAALMCKKYINSKQ